MKASLEFFGQLTDISREKTIEITDVRDTNGILERVYELFPGLKSANFVMAVNNNIINQNMELTDDCSIALMPPYSGG